ncbi:4-fold beta flower protein [Pseudoalteromonas sp. S16_S37]|uniref:4-fold beta flower protein n=1 Tax=Pseudoalteromonas sp. S16_S37 TaxID=2720228 RepID=UPI00406D22EE
MLFPLFDKNCKLVAWLLPNAHIFDTKMNWVAYLKKGHAWSAKTNNWLGPVNGLVCLNKSGQPLAWNPHDLVKGTSRPSTPWRSSRVSRPRKPLRQVTPFKPSRPCRPSGGWADESFATWTSQ